MFTFKMGGGDITLCTFIKTKEKEEICTLYTGGLVAIISTIPAVAGKPSSHMHARANVWRH